MMHTEKCVHCLRPAELWTGYVISPNGDVLAGWCASCHRIELAGNLRGFTGRYTTALGKLTDAQVSALPRHGKEPK